MDGPHNACYKDNYKFVCVCVVFHSEKEPDYLVSFRTGSSQNYNKTLTVEL